jgi:hypothetical protein
VHSLLQRHNNKLGPTRCDFLFKPLQNAFGRRERLVPLLNITAPKTFVSGGDVFRRDLWMLF